MRTNYDESKRQVVNKTFYIDILQFKDCVIGRLLCYEIKLTFDAF